MESESFVSRVMALIQKSRRALLLYSTAGGSSFNQVEESIGELPPVQVAEYSLSEVSSKPFGERPSLSSFSLSASLSPPLRVEISFAPPPLPPA